MEKKRFEVPVLELVTFSDEVVVTSMPPICGNKQKICYGYNGCASDCNNYCEYDCQGERR